MNHNIDKGTKSNPSKENVTRMGVKKNGKGSKQFISTTLTIQSHDMDDAREDSNVLRMLHTDIMKSGVSDSPVQVLQMVPSVQSCSTSGAEPSDSNSCLVQKVDVSGETNLEVVASKLKEATEIILE